MDSLSAESGVVVSGAVFWVGAILQLWCSCLLAFLWPSPSSLRKDIPQPCASQHPFALFLLQPQRQCQPWLSALEGTVVLCVVTTQEAWLLPGLNLPSPNCSPTFLLVPHMPFTWDSAFQSVAETYSLKFLLKKEWTHFLRAYVSIKYFIHQSWVVDSISLVL